MAEERILNRVVDRAADLASGPQDTDQERLKKATFVILALTGALIITPIWGTLYLLLGAPLASLGPYGFMVVVAVFVVYALRTGEVGPFLFLLSYYNLASSIWIHVTLGGFHGSSAVMLWAIFTVVGLLLYVGRKQAFVALPIFLAALAVLALLESRLSQHADLPDGAIAAFYFLNIGAASVVLVAVLLYSIIERDQAQERSDFLLLNILPKSIAQRLKHEPGTIADRFDETTILFMDLEGFTSLAAELPAEDMVSWLNDVYTNIDRMVLDAGAEKVKTIGDGYMAAVGVPEQRADHASVAARLALEIMEYMQRCAPLAGHPIRCRIGLSSGPVIGGVIGTHKFQYDLYGDTVNTASRMESHAEADHIQVAEPTYELLVGDFILEPRGPIEIKGKGLMETYYLIAERSAEAAAVGTSGLET